MAVPSAMAGTNPALSSAQELATLLSTAFGPQGRAVLSRNQVGQMVVTRSGCNILQCVCSPSDSPQRKILMNCAENVHGTFGDGVKSFVIMTAEILKLVTALDGPSRVAKQLSVIQSSLAQLKLPSNPKSISDCSYYRIILTFLGTRFPPPVSGVLGPLLHEFVSKSCCTCTSVSSAKCNVQSLESLYSDFSVLFRYQDARARSVSDSSVKSGFTLSRRAVSLLRPGSRRLVVFTFDDSDSGDGKFDDLDVKCEIDNFLTNLRQDKGVTEEILLVTSVILSDLTLFNLRRRNVAVVHGTPIDEAKYLTRILRDVSNDVIVETEDFTENVSILFPSVHQVLIHGPTKELREEYAGTCRSAIKLLIETNKSDLRNVTVVGGGHFERTLCHYLTQNLEKPKNYIPKLKSRDELLNWHKLKSRGIGASECDREMYEDISKSFAGVDSDVIEAVMGGLLAIPRSLNQLSEPIGEVLEPLALRVGVIYHAIGAVITLTRIDQVLVSITKKSVKLP